MKLLLNIGVKFGKVTGGWLNLKTLTKQEIGNVEVDSNGKKLFWANGLKVGHNILWDSTIEWSSVDMLERGRHFTGVGAGWQDAGTKWVESPAQSAMIIALEELLEQTPERY